MNQSVFVLGAMRVCANSAQLTEAQRARAAMEHRCAAF
jgi:hypothetical protein